MKQDLVLIISIDRVDKSVRESPEVGALQNTRSRNMFHAFELIKIIKL